MSNKKIEGYVEHIVYRSEEDGYTVFDISENKRIIRCTCIVPNISEGEYIEMMGSMTVHNVYGKQFHAVWSKITIPGELKALERYLGGGAIKGIGPAFASRIINCFGEDTLRIIEEEPERLSEVKGISEKKAYDIAEQLAEKSEVQDAFIYMSGFGISLNMATKIYKSFGNNIYKILQENPYRLCDDIQGIGFKRADQIAEKAGIRKDSPFRISSAIIYILNQALMNGDMYLNQDVLKEDAISLLGVDTEYFNECLDSLSISGRIIRKRLYDNSTIVYHAESYYTELDTARRLLELNTKIKYDKKAFKSTLKKIKAASDIELDVLQENAVKMAASNGIFILTGGPGTGKTTTINTMIQYFTASGKKVLLASPTGRAAKRMQEATGFEASTIHRLLELNGDPLSNDLRVRFSKNEKNPLEADVVIIDEMSMVDIFLMHSLLSAITSGTHLVLVGDINQLPSVGAGRVLADMIESGCFPVVVLDKIFRQAAKSDIIVNAHKINKGEKINIDNKGKDFFFLKRDDYRVIQKGILTLLTKNLPSYTGTDPRNIQVLTPMKKGFLGVESLNNILQKYLNPPSEFKEEWRMPFGVFREGDKVMQIKNDYQLQWEIRGDFDIVASSGEGVFNGDMGIIKAISKYDHTVTVLFDDNKYVEYNTSALEELELAYAITVHKSQGSEYPAVIIPLLDGPQVLFTRNLLYTAITRAQKCIVILGSEETLNFMIDNKKEDNRNTTLGEMIKDLREI